MPNKHYQNGYDVVKHSDLFTELSNLEIQELIKIYSNLDESNADYLAGMVAGLKETLASRTGGRENCVIKDQGQFAATIANAL